ncbi:MAG: elongation factor P maturation arginine rhamnosyltransferase EarP [Burkholderiaceae bacterium]
MSVPRPALWDIFCRVIDNLGDIGVCWRLCADLASRGQRVRLWIDEPAPLRWMAPGALEGRWPDVQVIPWSEPLAAGLIDKLVPADAWIEAFGCDPPESLMASMARHIDRGTAPPTWINLEYLSAESWVERCHGLPSPVMSGPLKGLTKTFFYPGFTPGTGGLLREPDLDARHTAFDVAAWRRRHHVPDNALAVSLFCYDPAPALPALMAQATQARRPVHWMVTPGRAATAMAAALEALSPAQRPASDQIHVLPLVDQPAFDEMLWACDLNIVRGEDSLVRALWAGKPFIWHIYPQHDDAHHAKLDAFLDWLEAPAGWRTLMGAWNRTGTTSVASWPGAPDLDAWSGTLAARLARADRPGSLTDGLLSCVLRASG